ncbi:hypothetical protein Lal_00039814 [Lupinus albus]|nr:hypothetical protein Lal_00039814 [Lupinus albus]
MDRYLCPDPNILLRIIPTTSGEKEAFTYYTDGVNTTPLVLIGGLGEEALRLGINNTEENFIKSKISSLVGSELTKEWLGHQISIFGVEEKEIVGVTLSYQEPTHLMLRTDLLQEEMGLFSMVGVKPHKPSLGVLVRFSLENLVKLMFYELFSKMVSKDPEFWKPRLIQRFSLERERCIWEGEILGYTGGFSPERELYHPSEKWQFWAREGSFSSARSLRTHFRACEERDPKVGGGVGRIREVAKNRTPILIKVNRRMKYARSGALGALDFGFTIYVIRLVPGMIHEKF